MQNKKTFEMSLLKKSNVPLDAVQRGDVVKIADSDLDWLQKYYNENYDGSVANLFSNRFAVAVLNDIPGSEGRGDVFFFLVRAIDNGKYIQVDMYQKSVGDYVLWTEILDNSHPIERIDGNYHTESFTVVNQKSIAQHSEQTQQQEIAMYVSDVVRYVVFFMQENLNNPEIVTRKTEVHTESSGKPANKKKKKSASKKTVRRTMYVPKRIVVNPTEPTVSTELSKESVDEKTGESKEKRSYTGHIEAWATRGHKRRIVHKDGTIDYVDVKPSVHKRNPKIMEKGNNAGVDIKLKPRTE